MGPAGSEQPCGRVCVRAGATLSPKLDMTALLADSGVTRQRHKMGTQHWHMRGATPHP